MTRPPASVFTGNERETNNLVCLALPIFKKSYLWHLLFNVYKTKSTQSLWKLRTHLTGILQHTKSPSGKLAFGFYDILQFPHDCNLTINALLKVLADYRGSEEPLPQVLYLQLDNSFQENKNKYLLSFCSLLVEWKIFQKVCELMDGQWK